MRALHNLCGTIFLCVTGGCHNRPYVQPRPSGDSIHFTCNGPRNGIPGSKLYRCSIDIPASVGYERWLVLPFFMEEQLRPRQKVVLIEIGKKNEELSYCGSRQTDDGFDAILVPAYQTLRIPEWRLTTFENRSKMTIWLGATPSLSNGDTLSALCQRLISQRTSNPDDYDSGTWSAPNNTYITFDPIGFQPIDIRSLSPW